MKRKIPKLVRRTSLPRIDNIFTSFKISLYNTSQACLQMIAESNESKWFFFTQHLNSSLRSTLSNFCNKKWEPVGQSPLNFSKIHLKNHNQNYTASHREPTPQPAGWKRNSFWLDESNMDMIQKPYWEHLNFSKIDTQLVWFWKFSELAGNICVVSFADSMWYLTLV